MKLSNADRLRAMTNSELIDFFCKPYEGKNYFECPVDHPCGSDADCRDCWSEWLAQKTKINTEMQEVLNRDMIYAEALND